MNNLSGAAQISCVLFIFVIILLSLELIARKRQRFYEKSSGQNMMEPIQAKRFVSIICLLICLIPFFFLDRGRHLLRSTPMFRHLDDDDDDDDCIHTHNECWKMKILHNTSTQKKSQLLENDGTI